MEKFVIVITELNYGKICYSRVFTKENINEIKAYFKLKPYIFAIWWCKPLIFRTLHMYLILRIYNGYGLQHLFRKILKIRYFYLKIL